MRTKLKIVLTMIAIGIIVCIIYLLNNNKQLSINDEDDVSSLITQEYKWLSRIDDNNISTIFHWLLNSSDLYWKISPLSKKFKNNFKTVNDIIPNYEGNEITGYKLNDIYNRDILVAETNNKKYYFEYSIDKYGLLDDLKLARIVDYVDNGWGGLKRKDGKIEINKQNIYNLLHYIANDNVSGDISGEDFENYTADSMPISENCKIINRPNIDIIGMPESSYWYSGGLNGDYNEEDIYSKDGFKYLIFEYDDHKIKYEVRYHVNDEYFFDYIEFVEVEN